MEPDPVGKVNRSLAEAWSRRFPSFYGQSSVDDWRYSHHLRQETHITNYPVGPRSIVLGVGAAIATFIGEIELLPVLYQNGIIAKQASLPELLVEAASPVVAAVIVAIVSNRLGE